LFQCRLDELNKGKKNLSYLAGCNINEEVCEALIQVSYRVAKARKAHTVAETLIKQWCITDIVETMIGEKFSNIIRPVPLPSYTVSRQIHEMSTKIENEVIKHIKSGRCEALQLHETMDVARPVVLFAVAQYINNNSTEDELLFCKPLKTRNIGEDIFKLVDLYLREEGPSWE